MPITEKDSASLKPWLKKRTKELSDADPDVLSDYVLALLKNNVEGEELMKLLTSELSIFISRSDDFAKELVQLLDNGTFVEDSKAVDGIKKSGHEQQLAAELSPIHKNDGSISSSLSTDPNEGNHRGDSNQLVGHVGHGLKSSQKTGEETLLGLVSTEEEPTNNLIIAELPEDKLQEPILKSFFQRFGEIISVEIDFENRMAEIEFKDHNMATQAWVSPIPIFDNRFIKVFFKKPTSVPSAQVIQTAANETDFDVEQFKLDQHTKQKEWEEKRAKRNKYKEGLENLIAMKEKMLFRYEKELEALAQELMNHPEQEVKLLAKLNTIEALMKENGVTPEQIATDRARLLGKPVFPSKGRRTAGPLRSRTASSFGGSFSPYSRPSSNKLDLRTKTVLVRDFTDINNPEFQNVLNTVVGQSNVDSITIHGTDLAVSFKERYIAEKFMRSSINLSEEGTRLTFQWDESTKPITTDSSVGSTAGEKNVAALP